MTGDLGRFFADRRIVLGSIVAIALVVRLALMWPRIGLPADDPDNYLPLARSVASGRGLAIHDRPTAYRPPLYPILLAPLTGSTEGRFSWPIAAFHLALGCATVLLTAATARRWGLGDVRVRAAAMIVAIDPVLAAQSRSIMTETLAACLLAGAMHAATIAGKKGLVASGVWFGLASLCRPSTLPAAVLASVFLAIRAEGTMPRRIASAAILLASMSVILSPWAIRNRLAMGEWIATTTHGGHTFALANNPEYYDDVLHGPVGAVWGGPRQKIWFERITRQTRGLGEPRADRRLQVEGWKMLRDRPRDFLRASIARLVRFWGIAPSPGVYDERSRLATAAWTVPLWIALALGLARRETWRWPRVVAPAILMALTLVHLIFWTDLRMRAPVVPAIALTAATASIGPRKKNEEKSGNGPNRAVQSGRIG